ncbi:hypothetical protein MBLNU459_g4779t1 [Dothideomycetes sp. NU459]
MNGGPLSGASMGIQATTEDCAFISKTTTSVLPTASYGIVGTIGIASPTSQSSLGLTAVKRDKNNRSRFLKQKRALDELTPPYTEYVKSLRPVWVSQQGDTSGQWFNYPLYGHASAGVNGIYGCTAVMITSEKGVYISHIWEVPVFIDENYIPTTDDTFTASSFDALRDGNVYAQSITALIGTDLNPGVLHAIYAPKVFVLTPFTTDLDRLNHGITTELIYDSRAKKLAQQLVIEKHQHKIQESQQGPFWKSTLSKGGSRHLTHQSLPDSKWDVGGCGLRTRRLQRKTFGFHIRHERRSPLSSEMRSMQTHALKLKHCYHFDIEDNIEILDNGHDQQQDNSRYFDLIDTKHHFGHDPLCHTYDHYSQYELIVASTHHLPHLFNGFFFRVRSMPWRRSRDCRRRMYFGIR